MGQQASARAGALSSCPEPGVACATRPVGRAATRAALVLQPCHNWLRHAWSDLASPTPPGGVSSQVIPGFGEFLV